MIHTQVVAAAEKILHPEPPNGFVTDGVGRIFKKVDSTWLAMPTTFGAGDVRYLWIDVLDFFYLHGVDFAMIWTDQSANPATFYNLDREPDPVLELDVDSYDLGHEEDRQIAFRER